MFCPLLFRHLGRGQVDFEEDHTISLQTSQGRVHCFEMENRNMNDPDWREKTTAKSIEYPPCFRADRTNRVGPEPPSLSSNALTLDSPCLRQFPRYSSHGRPMHSPSSCAIDADPSTTPSQRSDWTANSESTRPRSYRPRVIQACCGPRSVYFIVLET
jgi:hypothetical protein